jgi:Domain of unknown function (DUF1848)
MIVSASRRTDIPAYYTPWLMGRISAGYCLVRNPYNAKAIRRVSLDPADLDFLVLWTRDPRPLAPRLGEIEGRGIRFYVQMSLTGYPRAMEPGAPPLREAIDALRDLSDRIGSERVLWRYDPVILAEGLDSARRLRAFERIAAALEGRTRRVTLSVLDEYSGTRSRLERAGFPDPRFDPLEYAPLLGELAAIARSRGMTPQTCAEGSDLRSLGIEAGACVDAGLAASLWNIAKDAAAGGPRDSGQRGACRCAPSVDIGAYGTCPRGCAYCYATRGAAKLAARGPEDEFL